MRLSISRHGALRVALFAFIAPVFFVLSWLLTTPYTGGDQLWYRRFYDAIRGVSISEVPYLQAINTGSAEPLYGLIMWLGANGGFDKDVYIAIFNVMLALAIVRMTMRGRSLDILFCVLLLTNFYTLVLFTSAERLKFAYLAFALAAVTNQHWKTLAWTLAAPVFHFQSIIFIAARCSGYAAKFRPSRYIKIRRLVSYAVTVPLISIGGYLFISRFSSAISGKLDAYSGSGSVGSVANIALLAVVAILALPQKGEAILALLACGLASILIGHERVNMIAVSLFVWFAIRDERTENPYVLAIMAYFSLKSIDYVQNIFSNGNGFSSL